MKRSDFVIVIGRQYGSGGRELGQMLARRLGIPYYDKALLSEAAGRLGFRADLFERADEKRPSFFSSLLSANYGSSTYFAPGAMHNATLYQMQSDVIRNLMDSPCVIVGRTADYIGRERKNVVSIFLHADNGVMRPIIIFRCVLRYFLQNVLQIWSAGILILWRMRSGMKTLEKFVNPQPGFNVCVEKKNYE